MPIYALKLKLTHTHTLIHGTSLGQQMLRVYRRISLIQVYMYVFLSVFVCGTIIAALMPVDGRDFRRLAPRIRCISLRLMNLFSDEF